MAVPYRQGYRPFVAARSNSGLRAAYLSLLYMGVAAWAAAVVLIASSGGDDFYTYALVIPGLCAMVAGKVCAGILLYRCWSCLERHASRVATKRPPMDPGLAVALVFIPGVNLFGWFIGLGRLPGELNRMAQALRLDRTAPRDLGHFTAIMLVCAVIPVVGILTAALGALVLMPVLICSCSSLSDAIETVLSPAPVPESGAPIA